MASTDMNSLSSVDLSHRKRKRRRRQDKPAISARLILDDHVRGDVGILSQDLFAELFPHLRHGQQRATDYMFPMPLQKLTAHVGRCRGRRECAPRPSCSPCRPRTVVSYLFARDDQLDNSPCDTICRSCALDRAILSLVSSSPELRDHPATDCAVQALQP